MKEYTISLTTAVLESKSYRVRCVSFNGETVFCASDVLSACGIKNPSGWICDRKKRKASPSLRFFKCMVPSVNKGFEAFREMYVMDAQTVVTVAELLPASQDAKSFLLSEVAKYRIQPKEDSTEEAASPVPIPEPHIEEKDLGLKIDLIIFELLEMKKAVCYQ